MADYVFDASATTRYVRSDANGSGDGTANTVGGAWTLAQFAAAATGTGLNGFDVWFVGSFTATANMPIGSGANGSGRPLRLLPCTATPGDVTGFASSPAWGVSGGFPDDAYVFSLNRFGVVLANFAFSAPTRRAGFATSGQNRILYEDIDCSTIIINNAAAPACLRLDGGPGCVMRRCRAVGGFKALQAADQVLFVNCFGRSQGAAIVNTCSTTIGSISAPISGAAFECHQGGEVVDSVGLSTGSPLTVSGTPRPTRFARNVLVGQGDLLQSGLALPSAAAVTDNVLGPHASTALTLGPSSFLASGYATGNATLSASPFIAHATGDLRLTSAGRLNRRCIETMRACLETPIPSSWLRDDAATLNRYLAEINGYGRATSPLV